MEYGDIREVAELYLFGVVNYKLDALEQALTENATVILTVPKERKKAEEEICYAQNQFTRDGLTNHLDIQSILSMPDFVLNQSDITEICFSPAEALICAKHTAFCIDPHMNQDKNYGHKIKMTFDEAAAQRDGKLQAVRVKHMIFEQD